MPKPKRPPVTSSIGDYIRRQRQLANISLRKMAEQSGISAAVLNEIENGLRNPSRTILQSIAGALRLSAETLQLQAGVLDPKDADEIEAVREIRRDPHLTERQRATLVEIYEAFRAVNRTRRDCAMPKPPILTSALVACAIAVALLLNACNRDSEDPDSRSPRSFKLSLSKREAVALPEQAASTRTRPRPMISGRRRRIVARRACAE